MDGPCYRAVAGKDGKSYLYRMKGSRTRHFARIGKTEFRKVFVEPDISRSCEGIRLVAKKNCLGRPRFGVTFVRHYGNAVQRNYSKRIMKEFFWSGNQACFSGYDIIVVLYAGEYDYCQRRKQFESVIQGTIFD